MYKHIIISSLTFILSLGCVCQSYSAAVKDSTRLATATNLKTDLNSSGDGVPVGTVITWSFSHNPDVGEWRDCNGKPLPDNCKLKVEKGIANAPDYQNMFLRGQGSKTEALGSVQQEAVHIGSEQKAKIKIYGITYGLYTNLVYRDGGSDGNYSYSSYEPVHWNPNGLGNHIGGGTDPIEQNLELRSTANETRPANVAVRYLIRIN